MGRAISLFLGAQKEEDKRREGQYLMMALAPVEVTVDGRSETLAMPTNCYIFSP